MAGEIISRDVIKAQAQRAAEADFKADRKTPNCPYQAWTEFADAWHEEYRACMAAVRSAKVISTFADGPAEQLEVANENA